MSPSENAPHATLLQRAALWWQRRRRARRLGCEFGRSRDFEVPRQIDVGGRAIGLHVPQEHGIKAAFIDLLLDDCYGLELWQGSIARILDIGANVGLFGIAARRAFPVATIHCYEPNPALEQYLRDHAREAGFTYYMEAVGLRSGRVMLDFGEDSVFTRSHANESGSIPQVALSEAISRAGGTVDLLKIDCEGAEWEMFEDPAPWRAVTNLAMEYHLLGEHSHQETVDTVRRLGFRLLRHVPMVGCGIILGERAE